MLGPLLFLIYVNDLPYVPKILKFYLFADDTSIYYASENSITLQETVNRELREVRTNYVIFHSPAKKVDGFIQIKLGRNPIERIHHIKYLGVLVDSTLSWKPHVTELSKKLAKSVGIFFKIRHYVTLETLKLLYYSLFYCFISYCTSVWGLTHPSVLDPLSKLQKKVIRAILFKDQLTHSTPLFSKLQILKLNDIYSLQLLCLVFESEKGPTFHHVRDYFTPISSVHGHFTRQASQGNIFTIQVNATHYGLRSFRYAAALLRNNLPLYVRELSTQNSLINELEKIICSHILPLNCNIVSDGLYIFFPFFFLLLPIYLQL